MVLERIARGGGEIWIMDLGGGYHSIRLMLGKEGIKMILDSVPGGGGVHLESVYFLLSPEFPPASNYSENKILRKEFKPSGNVFLKHLVRIIFPAHGSETCLVRGAIPPNRILEVVGVVEINIVVGEALGLGGVDDLRVQRLGGARDFGVVGRPVPRG